MFASQKNILLLISLIFSFSHFCLYSHTRCNNSSNNYSIRHFIPIINSKVVVTQGIDAFILGPNCKNIKILNEITYPIGGIYFLDDVRYLIKFNIKETLVEYGFDLANFSFSKAILVLKTSKDPSTSTPFAIKIHPLTKPFLISDPKTGWYNSSVALKWTEAGGDYDKNVYSKALLNASGSQYVFIDVTPIIKLRFNEYKRTGKWFDPGMIIMRDVKSFGAKGYRFIYNFKAAYRIKDITGYLYSPQLYIK